MHSYFGARRAFFLFLGLTKRGQATFLPPWRRPLDCIPRLYHSSKSSAPPSVDGPSPPSRLFGRGSADGGSVFVGGPEDGGPVASRLPVRSDEGGLDEGCGSEGGDESEEAAGRGEGGMGEEGPAEVGVLKRAAPAGRFSGSGGACGGITAPAQYHAKPPRRRK